jgi:type VI secretion system secreted protein Hcp
LAFAKVDLEYRPQKADGSLDAGIHFKYDIKAHKEG